MRSPALSTHFTAMATSAIFFATAAVGAAAQTAGESNTLAAPAAARSAITYHNTSNRAHTNISGKEAKTLASTAFVLTRPSEVLVQFTSQLGNLGKAGCPCSVRASLVVDNGVPIVVKRVNLSGGTGDGPDYVPDRQGNDGSYVFTLPAGRHEVALMAQQVSGSAETIQAFYANLQAIVFSK